MSCIGVVSTVVPDSAHKLFIGGLPNYLNDDQVRFSLKQHMSHTTVIKPINNDRCFHQIFMESCIDHLHAANIMAVTLHLHLDLYMFPSLSFQ